MKQLEGPKTPGFLQKIQWSIDPISYLDVAARKFPDIFKAQISAVGKSQVLISNPEAIQQIFSKDLKGKLTIPATPFAGTALGKNSLLTQKGKRHANQRKLLTPPLHGERMHSYGQLICDITKKNFGQLPAGKTFSAHQATKNISLQLILEIVFGLCEGERYELLKELFVYWSNVFRSPLFLLQLSSSFLQKDLGSWSPWGDFLRKRQQIDQLLYAEISDRRAKPDPDRTDIITLLLSARHEDGEPMTDVEVRDQTITLLVAGHETTATAIAWSLYFVHRHPEIRDKLLEELASLGDSPDPMSVFQLPYLTAVCHETLRIYPVTILAKPRMVKSPVELMGYELEPDTAVFCCIYLTHHREDLYPNPKQFKPERFLERQFSPYEFMPFGGGSRRCIGAALAMFEMKLVLATILSGHQLALADNKPVKPVRSSVTLVPDSGVRMVMKGKRIRQQIPQPVVNSVY